MQNKNLLKSYFFFCFKCKNKNNNSDNNTNISNIKNVIDETIASEKFKEGRDQARKEAWIYPGEATKRTVDYIISKNEELQSKC